MRALLSVYDKSGLLEFAFTLHSLGYELVSTGGTLATLLEGGLPVTSVSSVTEFPEILDGRVKTLHPAIHAGLLARKDLPEHVAALKQYEITPVDVVVNNLYPFKKTIRAPEVTLADALENIDIGGPAMLRAAAKNFPDVVVLVDPTDYPRISTLLANGEVPQRERKRLAAKVFHHVSVYDSLVSAYLSGQTSSQADNTESLEELPAKLTFNWHKVTDLRYGENPHQAGAVYTWASQQAGGGGMANAQLLHGIPMSYLNYFDADAAIKSVASFPTHAVSIIKHANPCGLAVRDTQTEAYVKALEGDNVSAFGGIVGFNSTVSAQTAQAMHGQFFDVIIARGYEAGALELFRRRKNTRVVQVQVLEHSSGTQALDIRCIDGGLLVQQLDDVSQDTQQDFSVVTERAPTNQEWQDLLFAWKACRFIHSNAIVFVKDNAIVGMGAGQPNRLMSVAIAGKVSGTNAVGTVMASDAFFPFPDGIEEAAKAGVTAVIQPGGSIRDKATTAATNNLGLAMVFTGRRHFFH